ncbi:DUF6044 family protein [Halobacillus salinarum]|uniref:DUF6044 family protein n=1 Tax=Halobacillus salinarum TaxID=2932257 RepID=A0ABY4EHR9_9BACI|nr:DUF6044 family protein [Halobacillus salinarum]UOQ44019.1 DUF6044 family protein [Halobacillus salinarum]
MLSMWSVISRNFSRNKGLALASLIVLAYLMPYYILGEDTHIRIHDNLDSNIVWYKLLAESGQIFASPGERLPNVINGLPRSSLSSALDLMPWLYVWFKPFTAYTINQTLMRFVALFGMYGMLLFLLRPDNQKVFFRWMAAGVAAAFAILPFWPSGALSIAGLPAAFLAFLYIRKYGKHAPKFAWGVLVFLPFHSSLILTFVFVLALMGALWLFDWIKEKQVNKAFFLSLAIMSTIYLAKNYLLIASMFIGEGFTPHRQEFDLGHNSFMDTLRLFNKNFVLGHTHDLTIHQQVIMPVVFAALIVAFVKKINDLPLVQVLIMNILLSLWYAFWYWEGWRVLKDHSMLLNTFNFSRIHFLHPFLWYVAFAFALVIIAKNVKAGRAIALVLIIVQLALLFQLDEEFKYSKLGTPTFAEFYSKDLFDDIKAYIDKDPSDYRVVSVAMHPTIAQFNGMYTLDTYNVTYPLAYKHKFQKIIGPELAKNKSLKNYFDTWGSRLYMYVGELGEDYMFSKHSKQVIDHLDIRTKPLEELGGDYILSGLPIKNYKSLGLSFEHAFQNEQSPWKVYLYKIK